MKKIVDEVPSKTKVLNLKKIGDISYEEIDLEELNTGKVLVKIKACGICSSDIPRIFETGTYHFPTVPGHEFSGEVVAVADDENENLLGKKVAIFPLLPCGNCESCLTENYALCSNYNYFGSRCNGGFSEYLVVPVWNLVLLDDDVDYLVASLMEPAAVALHAVKKAQLVEKDNVLIIGTGTIAFMIGMFSKYYGANVTMACRREESKEKAIQNGFSVINSSENMNGEINDVTNGKGMDVVFEAVGSTTSIKSSIMSVNAKGTVILVGNPHGDITLNKDVYWRILRKELKIKGTWNSNYSKTTNDWKEVAKLMKEENINFSQLITNVYNFEDYKKAFEKVKDDTFSLKVTFKND